MNGNLDVLRGLASAVWRSSRFLSRTKILLLASSVMFMSMGIAQVIHIEGRNMSLRQILDELKKQSGYSVFIRKDVLDNASTINLQKKNRTVEELLEEVTRGQQLDYQIKGKEIVLSKKATAPQAVQKTSRSTVELDAQQETVVRGVLVDTEGKPVAKATVSSKSTGTKVESDASGRFQIKVSLPDELLVSYIGFAPKRVAVADTKALRITLQSTAVAVEDVVVTGIFERPEGNFTGAVTSISGAELKNVSSSNVFAAISALDPAFRIVPNNAVGGNINEMPEIQIRGANSMPNLSGELSANPNAPLFILDGFEVTLQRVVDLDMNMIQSITILKDASATSIYGSRGANGVLVITSVAPKPGKIQVTFNNDFRLTTPDLSVYNLLNAREKLDFEKRVGFYTAEQGNRQYILDQVYNDRAAAIASGVDTDWLGFPTQVGTSNRSTLYLQGGDEYIRYGLQLSGDFQNGVMKGQKRNNYSGQFDLTYNVKNLRFQNSIRIFQNTSNESPYGSFAQYARMNPYWRPFDSNGLPNQILESNTFGTFTNPLYDATLNTLDKSQYFGISNNLKVRWNIMQGLHAETSFSLNKQNGSSDQFYPAQHSKFTGVTNVNEKGSYDVRNDNSLGYESLTTLNYTKNINKHLIYSTLGFNIASNSNNYYSISTVGFPFDRLDNLLFANQYKPNTRPIGDESTVRRLGYLFNANYAYDNRYLLDFSARRDGSSQFGSDKRYGSFWSTGIGWNIHNEDFFVKNEQINRLKIRASYGSTGSLNIPAYRAQTRYSFGVDNVYDGELGAAIMGLGNRELSWQEVKTLNLGTDVTLFKERLDIRFEYYRSLTDNTITNVSLAPSNGFSDYAENLGKIQNTGFEFSGRYKIIDNKKEGILWSVNVGAITNKNILKELSNKLKLTNANTNAANTKQRAPNIMLEEGQAINSIFVVPSLGVDPITGAEVLLKKDGSTTFTWAAADKVAYGVTDPKWNGVFGTNLNYKGFELGMIFNYRVGGQMYNQTLVDKVQGADTKYNVDRRAYDLGWTKPGDESMFTKFGTTEVITKLSSRFVQDDNVLSLSSASLGYNFYRHAFVKRIGLNSFSLVAITNDLFTLSSIQVERGTNNPFARTFSLSLRAGF
ncbi:SusC/RagA family TonB-linked outer membrane protein [Sphingobacterium yanglingense]|uniref:TonB-linked SusC/RagA family outer membrane protein n=1 Tax=Sphingobacterium yanglingense TaxID=1437280 RepID=A0A4R6W6F3_9SPHI|nr:SusC/RagA family TonB-linked outer membrane protein [Sphingobacterium yanglingense]TDQ72238.1 TonB-linked SusC/RagA family outer membrane protein [Sphingobacterium yanglingense]